MKRKTWFKASPTEKSWVRKQMREQRKVFGRGKKFQKYRRSFLDRR